jgi:TonB family protein
VRSGRHPLAWALTGSALVHAAVLGGWAYSQTPRGAHPEETFAAPSVRFPVQVLPVTSEPRAPPAAAPTAGSLGAARPRWARSTASVGVAPEVAASVVDAPATDGPAPGDGRGEAGALTTRPALAGAGGDGTGDEKGAPGWAALHEQLAAAARTCYPDAARRFRVSGDVELDFCVGPGGKAAAPHLSGSTGSEALDRAARECVLERAQPLVVDTGCFRVPVHFGAL